MAFNGAGTRFISSITVAQGSPGGSEILTCAFQPLGSYPALGEPIATLLAAVPGSLAKFVAGVRPDNVIVGGDTAGGNWKYDSTQGTMGSIRNFADFAGTEHATGVYSAGELASVLRITFYFPLYGSSSR